MKNLLILIFIFVLPINLLAEKNSIVCLKTNKIKSIKFEKKVLVFETTKKDKFNISCKGAGTLTFESPVIIEPQKMGFRICSNDVLQLRNKTCFIDKIEPVKKDEETNS
tara:strand:+ start:145 stop:471 length:327 start_codon:yes stop_codon:yes gene_type:complete